MAFENTRRVTDVTALPAGSTVLNRRSARLTLADASRGFAVPKLLDASEESTYVSAIGVSTSELSARTELFWRGTSRNNVDTAQTIANTINFPAEADPLISTCLPSCSYVCGICGDILACSQWAYIEQTGNARSPQTAIKNMTAILDKYYLYWELGRIVLWFASLVAQGLSAGHAARNEAPSDWRALFTQSTNDKRLRIPLDRRRLPPHA